MSSVDLLAVEGLSKFFPVVRGVFGKTVGMLRAVDDISFRIGPGETLGLVGESGCGKTTAGRCILRLLEPSAGRVCFDGTDLSGLSQRELRPYRRRMQSVFQDPFASLNPRLRIVDIIGEGIERHGLASGAGIEREVREGLSRVGLSESWLNRYPHEFSGGQRQRIGIARAIALRPELIVCDEAVSALDVSVQAQVINLLLDLRRDLNLAYLFIAHDLSVVRYISDHVAVMYLGRIVELAPSAELFDEPAHPYTRALLSAVPLPDPRARRQRVVLSGEVPTPLSPPSGCPFHPRCPAAVARCSETSPAAIRLAGGRRSVRCIHAEGLETQPDWYPELQRRLAAAEAQRRAPGARAATGSGLDGLEAAEAASVAQGPAVLARVAERDPLVADAGVSDGSNSAAVRASEGVERDVQAAAALLLLVTAAVLSCWGRFGWGLLGFLAGGVWLGVRPPPWLAHSLARRLGRVLALAWLGCTLLSVVLAPVRRTARARADLAVLREEVEGYTRNVGRPPRSLAELRFRTVERFGLEPPRDPWGHPYRYRPAQAADPSALTSDGPDGAPSADDVR